MDLVKMMLAAGVQVKPEHFKKAEGKKAEQVVTEGHLVGQLHSFWIVTKPVSHRATLHDVMFEVTNLAHLAHWISGVQRTLEHEEAHAVLKSAKMFKDHAAAKDYAQTVIVKAVAKHHHKKSDEPFAEEEEESVYNEQPFEMDDEPKADEPHRHVRRFDVEEPRPEDAEHCSSEDEEYSVEAEEDAMSESTLDYDEANKVSWGAGELPVNVRAPEEKKDPTVFKKPEEEEVAQPVKVKIPVKIKDKLKALKAATERDFQRAAVQDKNAVGFYPTMIEVIQALLDDLDEGTVDGIKRAQITIGKLSDVFLHKIPADVVLFISKGGEPRSLKDIFTAVKMEK